MYRTLPRLLVGSAAVVTALAGTVPPASAAAPSPVKVRPHLADINVAEGGEGKVGAVVGWVDTAGPVHLRQLRVSVDTAGVADIATVVPDLDSGLGLGHSCTTTGTVISCTSVGSFEVDGEEPPLVALAALKVKARPGAEAGGSGTLAITAQADGGPVSSSTSTVRIGEGVDLAAGAPKRVTATPGTRAATDLRVANAGRRPIDGAVLLMIGWPAKLLDGPGFSNCRYGMLLLCTFTDVMAPGRTYALSEPVRLRIPADAAAGSSSFAFGLWFTTTEWQELLGDAPVDDELLLGKPGTGGPTRLKAEVAGAGLPQVDTNPDNNIVITETVVGGRRRTDLAAVGATVRGSAGDRVKARVGFANAGPGTLYPELFDNADPGTYLAVPPGLTAVAVDSRCLALPDGKPADEESFDIIDLDAQAGRPGAPSYLCATPSGSTAAGRRTLFDFTFEVRRKPSRTAGEVTINDEELLAGGGIDRNDRNDRAAVALVAGGATDDGGEGGGLPVTGADAMTVAVAGTLLVLAGAVAWLLVRRRRIRFTT